MIGEHGYCWPLKRVWKKVASQGKVREFGYGYCVATLSIGLHKGSGKRSRVREKSVKSQGILIWIMSGNHVMLQVKPDCDQPAGL